MTRWYVVSIETEGRLAKGSEDALERLSEVLAKSGQVEGGSVSWGGLAGGPGATLSLRSSDVITAAERAIEVFRKAVVEAGLEEATIARVDVMTEKYRDRWLDEPGPEYVGVSEVGQILGVSKQRVYELRQRSDFPKPIAELAAGPVWSRVMLNNFIDAWERKPGRPPKKSGVGGRGGPVAAPRSSP